jgi:NodT family efflux transporter outer membrane factor (OMF) lipoprotein
MTGRAGLALLGLLGAVAGCAVGPDYRPPTPPAGVAAAWRSASPSAESVAAPPDEWWRLYNDPRLDALIQEAFGANADLRAAEANLASARALLEAARADRYPSTDVALSGTYGRDGTTNEIEESLGQKPRSQWLYDDVFDMSYEVDLFGRVRRSIEASKADAGAVQAARDDVRTTVAAETARAYAQVCTLGEALAIANRSLAVAERQAEITDQRHDAGANTLFDVTRAQGLVAQERSFIPPLEGQRRSAVFQLAALLGRTPANAPTEVLDCVEPPQIAAVIPVGDGAALIRRRPDVREAERRLAAATARIGVATADLYPRISLTGFYGGAAPSIAALPTNAGLIWGVGPSVSWSFPNQAGPRARVRLARTNAAAALAGFDSAVLQALKETEQALATYRAEIEHRAALADADAKARQAFGLARDELSAGSVSPLDVLVAEQTLTAADTAVAASDGALAQDQIALFKALGGGWEDAPAMASRPVSGR